MKLNKLFLGLDINAAGLSAQRKRMNAVAENIANVETSRTESGGPYRRKIVQMKERSAQLFSSILNKSSNALASTQSGHFSDAELELSSSESVSVGIDAEESQDPTPFKMVYDPSHPDADDNGYVKMPNVNVVTEMVEMISASRAYEANVIAINAAKTMAKDTLEI